MMTVINFMIILYIFFCSLKIDQFEINDQLIIGSMNLFLKFNKKKDYTCKLFYYTYNSSQQ